MKKALGWALLVCVGIGFTALSASATEVVSVQVAPHMLLLSKVQSGEVTVHVGIPFSVVVESTIFMNGVAVSWTKADDCGNAEHDVDAHRDHDGRCGFLRIRYREGQGLTPQDELNHGPYASPGSGIP